MRKKFEEHVKKDPYIGSIVHFEIYFINFKDHILFCLFIFVS